MEIYRSPYTTLLCTPVLQSVCLVQLWSQFFFHHVVVEQPDG